VYGSTSQRTVNIPWRGLEAVVETDSNIKGEGRKRRGNYKREGKSRRE
jgi:hypothetical protein